METRVDNHWSHDIEIAGVSCITEKFRIINVEFSTPNNLSEDRDAPLLYHASLGVVLSISV
jgi:hypothetical protein